MSSALFTQNSNEKWRKKERKKGINEAKLCYCNHVKYIYSLVESCYFFMCSVLLFFFFYFN